MTNVTLREVWLYVSGSKICKITEKYSENFASWVSISKVCTNILNPCGAEPNYN